MRIVNYELVLDNDIHINKLKKVNSFEYKNISFNNPNLIYELFTEQYKLSILAEERIYLVALNTKMDMLGVFEVAKGTVNTCLSNIRGIFIRALLVGAVNIVLIHNHPSQNPTPSKEDIKVTNKMKEICNLMELNFTDHIIIGNTNYISFKEQELI